MELAIQLGTTQCILEVSELELLKLRIRDVNHTTNPVGLNKQRAHGCRICANNSAGPFNRYFMTHQYRYFYVVFAHIRIHHVVGNQGLILVFRKMHTPPPI